MLRNHDTVLPGWMFHLDKESALQRLKALPDDQLYQSVQLSMVEGRELWGHWAETLPASHDDVCLKPSNDDHDDDKPDNCKCYACCQRRLDHIRQVWDNRTDKLEAEWVARIDSRDTFVDFSPSAAGSGDGLDSSRTDGPDGGSGEPSGAVEDGVRTRGG